MLVLLLCGGKHGARLVAFLHLHCFWTESVNSSVRPYQTERWVGRNLSSSMMLGLILFVLLLRSIDGKKFFYEQSKTIEEVKGLSGYFMTSKKIRVVEFYSPFCVSQNPTKFRLA